MTKQQRRSKPAPGVPAYILHKRSGRAFTMVNGTDGSRRAVYLGPYGSPESRRRYREIVARHLRGDVEAGAEPPRVEGRFPALTVGDLVARFLVWAETYYRNPVDGARTGEYSNLVDAVRPLLGHYADELAADFGPLKLKTVREVMIDSGLARRTVNQRVSKLRRVFKWGAENELVPVTVPQALTMVAGLRAGRGRARETVPRQPVSDDQVDATLPHLPPMVCDMVRVQRLTGMRSGELCSMRVGDLDRSGKDVGGAAVWLYRVRRSKTTYLGKVTTVPLGPQAQAILAPYLRPDPGAYLFSPAVGERDRMRSLRAARKTKVQPSQRDRSKANPAVKPGECYSVMSYARAVARGCVEAGVGHWTPHQLRHSRATTVRREYGIEAARVALGHSHLSVTEIYAKADLDKAIRIAVETG